MGLTLKACLENGGGKLPRLAGGAQGVGVGAWPFASPDFPMGAADYAGDAGDGQEGPFVGGPAVDGYPSTTGEGAGAVHVSTGGSQSGNPAGRANHWSNLLDWRHGPLFWLLVATIVYFGLVQVRAGARINVR